MLTPAGAAAIHVVMAEQFSSAVIRIYADEETFADESLDEGFPQVTDEGVLFQATFGAESGNFAWVRKAIVLDGEVIDAEDQDMGSKVTGSEWTVKQFLKLIPDGD